MRYKKRSVFIDKDQEKTKKKYKQKYITEKYTEYRRKTRQRDGCVPGYGILNIPDKWGPPAKLVSVGFVVCGKNFEEVTRFHSYIYAEDKLHDRFQEMTRIERKDLLSAPDKYVIQRDLLVMCTGEAMAFSTLEEYIQKENAKIGIRNTNSEITQNNI